MKRILLIYVLLHPLIDILTSFMVDAGISLTVGTVLRALFLAFAGIYLLFFTGREGRKGRIYIYILVAYVLLQAGIFFIEGGLSAAFANVRENIRVFYYPVVLLLFISLYRRYGFVIGDRTLALLGGVYSLSIFIAYVTGTSFQTYSTAGYRGWFYAANEISAVISALLPSAVCILLCRSSRDRFFSLEKRPRVLELVLGITGCLLTFFAAFFIGTKVLIAVAFVYLFCVLIWCFINADFRRNRHSLYRSAAALGLSIVCFVMLILSPVSSGLKNRLDWFYSRFVVQGMVASNPTVASTTAQSTTVPGTAAQSTAAHTSFDTLADPIPKNQDSKLFRTVNWLFSSRFSVITGIQAQFRLDMPRSLLIGIGYAQLPDYTYSTARAVEMDYLSVFYRNGVVGLLIFALPGLWAFFRCIKKAFTRLKDCFCSLSWCTDLFQTVIVFVVGFFTGHTMVAPAASIFLVITTVKLIARTDSICSLEKGNTAD